MTDLRRIATGTVAIRGDDGGDGRSLDGYAYRWGETTPGAEEYPGMLEGFQRGAFQPAIAARSGRPWPYLDRHGGNVIGGIQFNEDETGLHYSGRLLDTVAAREYAATVPVNDGVSLEWLYRGVKSKRQGATIIHQSVPRIAALAGEYVPAYAGANVALRSGGNTVEDETQAVTIIDPPVAGPVPLTREQISSLATDAATEVMRQYAERGALTTTNTDPLAGYATLGEMVYAAARTGAAPEVRAHAARAIARRALDDTTFNSGANAALANGNLVTSELQRLVNAGRPAITAFGGPRSMGDIAGLTLNWPYFDGTLSDFVAAQSAEKAAIISASVDIKLATEAVLTYAGGSSRTAEHPRHVCAHLARGMGRCHGRGVRDGAGDGFRHGRYRGHRLTDDHHGDRAPHHGIARGPGCDRLAGRVRPGIHDDVQRTGEPHRAIEHTDRRRIPG